MTDTAAFAIRRLHTVTDAQLAQLADVLIDCVEGGASVSFMQPMTQSRATAFWTMVAAGVASGERALLVAEDTDGICGTVQLILNLPENRRIAPTSRRCSCTAVRGDAGWVRR